MPNYYRNVKLNEGLSTRQPFITQNSCVIEETETELMNSSVDNVQLGAQTPTNNSESRSLNNSLNAKQHAQLAAAPAIDFKLDVKIEINSGKCVLHASKIASGPIGGELGRLL